jgi:hypothetical protein
MGSSGRQARMVAAVSIHSRCNGVGRGASEVAVRTGSTAQFSPPGSFARPAAAVLGCRRAIVVAAVQTVGEDRRYPPTSPPHVVDKDTPGSPGLD